MIKIYILFLHFTFILNCMAQIAIYPSALFIDQQTRSGSISIKNPTNEHKEIDISLKFGYIGYDSTGNDILMYDSSIIQKKYSIEPYISYYPKKFILPGQEIQSIKFLIKNTSSLKDGLYWLRIISTSQNVSSQIDSTNMKDSIRVGFKVKLSFVTVLLYQKGKLNTSLEVTSLEAKTDSSKVNLLFNFKRSGNSPFIGNARIEIFDEIGNEVNIMDEKFPIYFDAIKRFSFDRKKFMPGKYKVEITLDNNRDDVPDEFKAQFKGFSKTFEFSYYPKK